MPDQKTPNPPLTLKKILKFTTALLVLVAAGLYLLTAVAITSPWASAAVSRMLSEQLRQTVTVAGLRIRGATLEVREIELVPARNPQQRPLLSVRSLTIAPDWTELLRGRRTFRAITLDSPTVTLMHAPDGSWNFSGLLKEMGGRKQGGAPVLIRSLVISTGSVSINDYTVSNLGLSLRDLSTSGTTDARLQIDGRDPSGNPFTFSGTGRAGSNPDLEIRLAAPTLSLAMIKGGHPALDLTKAFCSVDLKAGLHGSLISASGAVTIEQGRLLYKGYRMPVKGVVELDGLYRRNTDRAVLNRLAITLNDAIRMQAAGEMREVKERGLFTGTISTAAVELGALARQIPPELRNGLTPSGTLAPTTFRLSGNRAEGITAGSMDLSLSRGGLARGTEQIAQNLAAHAQLTLQQRRWHLGGTLLMPRSAQSLPVQGIDIDFTAQLTNRFHLVDAAISRMRVTCMGLPLTGTARFAPTEASPLKARIELPTTRLVMLNPVLATLPAQFSAGSASATALLSGSSLGDLHAEGLTVIQGARGNAGAKRFGCKELEIQTTAARRSGTINASSHATLSGGLAEGREINGTVAASLQNGALAITGGRFQIDKLQISLAEVRSILPHWSTTSSGKNLPLQISFRGLSTTAGDAALHDVSGWLTGTLVKHNGTTWLEGTGSTRVGEATYQGTTVGPVGATIRIGRESAAAALSGQLLGGTFTGAVSHDLTPTQRGTSFTVAGHSLTTNGLAQLAGPSLPVQLSGGALDLSATGTYQKTSGLDCRLEGEGRGISLNGPGNKSLLNDCGLKIVGRWNNGLLSLADGRVSIGKDIVLSVKGSLAQAATPRRTGEFLLELPSTPFSTLLDATAGMLPRALQEASVSGKAGLRATMRFGDGRALLDGSLSLMDTAMEVPAQKLVVSGVNGSVPLSLDFSGKAPRTRQSGPVSRQELAATVEELLQHGPRDSLLRIEQVRFGAMELGPTSLYMRAANGLTELVSFRSAAYRGTLAGSGHFHIDKGPQYGGNIILDGVSLRAFCDSYPAIKGYLSGTLSGAINLSGARGGIGGLEGYVDLWTRATRDEKMLVSKEFLQKLAGTKLKGIFFRTDRPYDRGEITAYLQEGYLTFETLDISHTNFLGIKDLNVAVAPVQNRIALDHLFESIKQAAERGKKATGGTDQGAKPQDTEFKWAE